MRIFHDEDRKVINFVAENNVVVGYDAYQSCCERWGFKFTDREPRSAADDIEGDLMDDCGSHIDDCNAWLEGWVFDPTYFAQYEESDCMYIAVFLVRNGDKVKYLVLINGHNGYYSHGFHMDVWGERRWGGSI